MLKNYLLSFVETARDPNKPLLLPWHEHGHVVATVLWRHIAAEHIASTTNIGANLKKELHDEYEVFVSSEAIKTMKTENDYNLE